MTTGPQMWCGEIESYGSGTPVRYGVRLDPTQTSSTEAVRPPEVEWKYAITRRPPYMSTSPAVSSTAAFVESSSSSTPR